MLEVIRIFGELRKLGWRPLRTIEFGLWDGEEYNLIGSTEHVEARIDELRRNGYAYLNVDVAVTGNDFEAAGCPIYERALLRVLGRVTDPVKQQTLSSIWEDRASKMQGLGAGSDYVAFQDIAGISSLDFGFQGPPFPYHSCYDNFEWMTKFGDPGLEYHALMAQIWALLILEMADTPVLPFDMEAYATAVKGYVVDLEEYVEAKSTSVEQDSKLDLRPLHEAADAFVDNAARFHDWDRTWSENVEGTGGFESNVMAIKRMSHNTRMANFETHLLDLDVGGGVSIRFFSLSPLPSHPIRPDPQVFFPLPPSTQTHPSSPPSPRTTDSNHHPTLLHTSSCRLTSTNSSQTAPNTNTSFSRPRPGPATTPLTSPASATPSTTAIGCSRGTRSRRLRASWRGRLGS